MSVLRSGVKKLVAQAERLDKRLVAFGICAFQVIEEITAVVDHAKKAVTRAKILFMGFEVLRQFFDALGQHGDLHVAGTGVALVALCWFADCGFVELAHGSFGFGLVARRSTGTRTKPKMQWPAFRETHNGE